MTSLKMYDAILLGVKHLTGIVFSIREVILRELHMNSWHLRRKVQRFLIAGDHGFWTGATLVCR